jgi:hypothetical protein
MSAPVPEKSPRRNGSVGIVRKAEAFWRRAVRSQFAKKNSLFFLIGPPNVPPNWFSRFFGISVPTKK